LVEDAFPRLEPLPWFGITTFRELPWQTRTKACILRSFRSECRTCPPPIVGAHLLEDSELGCNRPSHCEIVRCVGAAPSDLRKPHLIGNRGGTCPFAIHDFPVHLVPMWQFTEPIIEVGNGVHALLEHSEITGVDEDVAVRDIDLAMKLMRVAEEDKA
jgi:hypothetical protein